LLNRVEHAIESRRLARHLSACSASLCASNRLTRRREGAETGIAAEAGVSRDTADPDKGQYSWELL